MPPPGLNDICAIKNDGTILYNEGTVIKNTAPVRASVARNSAVLHKHISIRGASGRIASTGIEYPPALVPSKIISDYTSDHA